jgi:hypothetical protein
MVDSLVNIFHGKRIAAQDEIDFFTNIYKFWNQIQILSYII